MSVLLKNKLEIRPVDDRNALVSVNVLGSCRVRRKLLAPPLKSVIYSGDLQYPATQQIAERLWRVESPFVYTDYRDRQILVPVGFVTDYGSIPQVFWSMFDPIGNDALPYIVHDLIYATELFSRSECDNVLLYALQEYGDSWFYRNTVYCAVAGFGWSVWSNHSSDVTEQNRLLVLQMKLALMEDNNPWGIYYDSMTDKYHLLK